MSSTKILRRFDFEAWVRATITLNYSSGSEVQGDCPECGREKLAINLQRRAWRCFVCDYKGRDVTELVAAFEHCTRYQALQKIAEYAAGTAVGPLPKLEREDAGRTGRFPFAPMPRIVPYLDQRGYDYLVGVRGMSEDHIEKMNVGTVYGDRVRGCKGNALLERALFPVTDEFGRVVYWVARATDRNASIKVLNLPVACKDPDHASDCGCEHKAWGLTGTPEVARGGDVLFGISFLEIGGRAILVEGLTDAAICGPGFVASLGAHLTPEQAGLLALVADEVVIMFDPDEAGRNAYPKAHALLNARMPGKVAVVQCPEGLDPGDLGRDRALEIADAAEFSATAPLPNLVGGYARDHSRNTGQARLPSIRKRKSRKP